MSDGSSSTVDTVDQSVRWFDEPSIPSMSSTDRSGLCDIHEKRSM